MQPKNTWKIKINKLNIRILKIQVLTPYKFTYMICPKYIA